MKTKTHPRFLALLSLLLVFLTACVDSVSEENNGADASADTPVTYVYTEAPVSFNEPYGNLYQEASGWEVTQGSITYRFTPAISEEERTTVVDDVTAMLTYIEENFGAITEKYAICIRHDLYAPWTDGSTLYVGLPALRTPAFGATLAQMLYGREVNYGICYAFATELLQELGHPTDELAVTLEDALTVCETSPLLLDLNYACFLDAYTDAETLVKLKYLAIDFYRSLTREEKVDLLTNYSYIRYSQYLSKYLTAHGQEAYDASDLDGISFYPCGEKMRLVWEDPYAVFYLYDAYTVKRNDYDQLQGVNDLLNTDYEHFRYVVTNYRTQAEEAECLMGYLETTERETKPPVLFIRDNTHEKTYDGVYLRQDNEIRIYNLMTYPHEYTHYLTRHGTSTVWLQELLANYTTVRPGIGDWYLAWFVDICQNQEYMDDSALAYREFYGKVQTHLGRAFNWSDMADVREFFNARIVNNQIVDMVTGTANNFVLSSFVHYLTTLAEEACAVQAIYNDTPIDAFGKSWEELAADWKVWISREYAWILDTTA